MVSRYVIILPMANDARMVIILSKEDKAGLMKIAGEMRTTASALVRLLIIEFLKKKGDEGG